MRGSPSDGEKGGKAKFVKQERKRGLASAGGKDSTRRWDEQIKENRS